MKKILKSKKVGILFGMLLIVLAGVIPVRAATNNVVVRFWDNDGSAYYSNLRVKVEVGGKFTIPEVPEVDGYTGLGWSTTKGADVAAFAPGKVAVVKKNVSLYAVRRQGSSTPGKRDNNNNNNNNNNKTDSQVTFYTYSGKTNVKFRALAQTVKTGSYLTLPELPVVKGYTAVGWAVTKKAEKASYKEGKRVKITQDTQFYAFYEKLQSYTIEFFSDKGKSTNAFKKLKQTVTENEYLEMPAVPVLKNYAGVGWTTVQGSDSAKVYKAGIKFKVKKDIKLYAVYQKGVNLNLYKTNGKKYQTITVVKGDDYILPAAENTSRYTFMGWDTVRGKTTNPKYQAGDKVRIKKNTKLYAVCFDRTKEENLSETDLIAANSWKLKYSQVVFVGDSRTDRMHLALNHQFGADSQAMQDVHFVAKSGMGLTWLKNYGYDQLLKIVNKNGAARKPMAVIFNLGVNDLANSASYISYMESIAKTLKEKNCELFFMSINPMNSQQLQGYAKSHASILRVARREDLIRAFNKTMKSGLKSYRYMDAYTELFMARGYSTDHAANGIDTGIDDGLHYTSKTSKRMYRYCLEFLSR